MRDEDFFDMAGEDVPTHKRVETEYPLDHPRAVEAAGQGIVLKLPSGAKLETFLSGVEQAKRVERRKQRLAAQEAGRKGGRPKGAHPASDIWETLEKYHSTFERCAAKATTKTEAARSFFKFIAGCENGAEVEQDGAVNAIRIDDERLSVKSFLDGLRRRKDKWA